MTADSLMPLSKWIKVPHHLLEGLVIVDPPGFFIRALNGDHNTVRNVKTVGAWTYNTDGVSVGNNGLVDDSFFMVNDDAIKINNKRTRRMPLFKIFISLQTGFHTYSAQLFY